jgi:hypothetical protein
MVRLGRRHELKAFDKDRLSSDDVKLPPSPSGSRWRSKPAFVLSNSIRNKFQNTWASDRNQERRDQA